METCAGCGAQLAPAWKFCVYCGIAVPEREIPGAIRPEAAAADNRRRNRLMILGGIGIFAIGIALLIVSIVFFTGSLR